MKNLPEKFQERLSAIVPSALLPQVLDSFQMPRQVSLRGNPLKELLPNLRDQLRAASIIWSSAVWCPEVFLMSTDDARHPVVRAMVDKGQLYAQGLSSVLVPLLLDVRPGESVLDLCAGPGSKTGQMAAMMGNTGTLIANEPVRERYYKLKSVLNLLGVTNARLTMVDGRRFRSDEMFDRVLVDAPCSSEGRFRIDDAKSFGYWSERKIREMQHKQCGLLLKAFRLLKPGGTLIYSTCTFAPEENEAVIDWFLRKTGDSVKVMNCPLLGGSSYPALAEWRGKIYDPRVQQMVRILPDGLMTGFAIARIRKL